MGCVAHGAVARCSPPGLIQPRSGHQTSSDGTSPLIARTSCGSSTSPTCRRGRASLTRRSYPTCAPAGSSAGERRHRCRPSCRWTPWRWRCGSGPATARTSTGSMHHSDAGSQYTAIRYTLRLNDAGADQDGEQLAAVAEPARRLEHGGEPPVRARCGVLGDCCFWAAPRGRSRLLIGSRCLSRAGGSRPTARRSPAR